jgi:hypothetical protein
MIAGALQQEGVDSGFACPGSQQSQAVKFRGILMIAGALQANSKSTTCGMLAQGCKMNACTRIKLVAGSPG